MPREMPQNKETKPQDVVHIGYTFAMMHAGCFTPLIRSRFGCRAFRSYWLSGLLMFVYAGFANCPLLAWYIPVWVVMIACRHITCDRNTHSLFQGYSWVFGWMVNQQVARTAEVFICFFGGVLLMSISEPLGLFVMAGIVSLLLTQMVEGAVWQARDISQGDAEWEARTRNEWNRRR